MCTYPVERQETLIAYLYGEIDVSARAQFEAHLVACTACRDELDALRDVRGQLTAWVPPERRTANLEPRTLHFEPRTSNTSAEPRAARWGAIPAWAQVAAAMLFLGVAAGIANLEVRYDNTGLTVRTGWSKAASRGPASTVALTSSAGATRADLAALEQQLRAELRAAQTSAHGATATDAGSARPASDAELLRRVRALVDESEKRQQSELALRMGELLRDVNAQRQADLVRIDRSLGLVENNLGVEVLKQRQQVNYLMRVNQRQ